MEYSVVKTDALILGCGLSGLLAARGIAKSCPDKKITILGDGLGASPYVHGFNVPLHPDDSVACFEADTLKSGREQSNPALVDALCKGSLSVVPPLMKELGIEFNRQKDGSYSLLRPLGASNPRVASVGNHAGVAIMNAIRAEFAGNPNITEIGSTRALRLLKADGRVSGALTYSEKTETFTCYTADVVVLASGGFCNIYPFSTNMSDIGGDGIAMAFGAGASLCDMEFVQFEPSAAVAPAALRGKSVITTMFFEGAVLRNALGERFMLNYSDKGECVDKDVQAKCIFKEIKEGRGTEHGGVYFDATGVGREKLNELYASYVKRYADVGIDIATTPFEIAPAPHTSLGGVVIDAHCDTGIPGLYACGEVTGGLHGANRIGGNAGLETLVFGSIAGKSAAEYLHHTAPADLDEETIEDFVCDTLSLCGKKPVETELLTKLRAQMGEILSDKLNVLRCGAELEVAVDEFGAMLETLEETSLEGASAKLKFETIRLVNDLQTAYLLAVSAYTRAGSMGCHVRTDSVDEKEKYRIVIRNTPDGAAVTKMQL